MDTVRDVSVDFQMQRSEFDRTKMQNVPTDMLKSDLPSFSLESIHKPTQSSPLYHIMVGWVVDEKWPNLVAKKVCACFFAVLVESFFPPYLNLCLFSGCPDALCNGLSYAIEVFDDEESNERRTIWTFLSEHIKTASETPRYLQFLVVFDHFPHEIANGPTFIRFLVLF